MPSFRRAGFASDPLQQSAPHPSGVWREETAVTRPEPRFALNHIIAPGRGLADFFALAKGLGIDAVEIAQRHPRQADSRRHPAGRGAAARRGGGRHHPLDQRPPAFRRLARPAAGRGARPRRLCRGLRRPGGRPRPVQRRQRARRAASRPRGPAAAAPGARPPRPRRAARLRDLLAPPQGRGGGGDRRHRRREGLPPRPRHLPPPSFRRHAWSIPS